MENENENKNFESIVEAYTETDQKIHEEMVKENNENNHIFNKNVPFLPSGIFGLLFCGVVIWLIVRAVRNRR